MLMENLYYWRLAENSKDVWSIHGLKSACNDILFDDLVSYTTRINSRYQVLFQNFNRKLFLGNTIKISSENDK